MPSFSFTTKGLNEAVLFVAVFLGGSLLIYDIYKWGVSKLFSCLYSQLSPLFLRLHITVSQLPFPFIFPVPTFHTTAPRLRAGSSTGWRLTSLLLQSQPRRFFSRVAASVRAALTSVRVRILFFQVKDMSRSYHRHHQLQQDPG